MQQNAHKYFKLLGLKKNRKNYFSNLRLSRCGTIDAFVFLGFILLSNIAFGTNVQPVQITSKSLKEASHFELSGPKEWRYDVVHKDIGGSSMVSIQFSGVTPEQIQKLENFRDSKVQKIVVKEGLNKDAVAEVYLAPKMNFFDYQTDGPTVLVFDVYQNTPAVKPVVKKSEKPKLSEFARIKNPNKRSIASLDNIQLGHQPLLSEDKNTPQQFNVLDLADKDNKRLKMDFSEIKEEALIRSEKEIYLAFPELIKGVTPSLSDIENNKTTFDVPKEKEEENQIVRLIIRLFNEEKYAMALKTYKFLEDKYPKTKYAEVLHILKAEIYYKIWKRDKKDTDLETAIGLYQEHILRYPQSPLKEKLTYFIGMIQFDRGQYLNVLNNFQAATKVSLVSSYHWQMKMMMAECYRNLKQQESALSELTSIESNAPSKEISQQAKFKRGDVYFKMGQYSEAMNEYTQAIKAHPQNAIDSAPAYYNTAESLFRQKEYKKAMEQYLVFLKKFPDHPFGGYALNRVGAVLEILGAAENKTVGAYLESHYRFRGSPGAYVSKLKINLARFHKMKPKEVDAVVKEALEEMPVKDIDDIESLVKISLADGFLKRHQFDKSLEIYTRYYKEKLRSPYLSLVKDRIYKTLTEEIKDEYVADKNMKVIQLYLKNKESWLKDNPRTDTDFFLAHSYEKLNLLDIAEKYYSSTDSKLSQLSKDQEKRRLIFENSISLDTVKLRLAKVTYMQDEIKKSNNYLSQVKNPQQLSKEEKVELSLITADNAEKEARYDVAIAQLKNLSESWQGKNNLLIEPWLRISHIYDVQKKPEEALKWADQAVTLITGTKNSTEDFDQDLVRKALEYTAELNQRSGKIEKAITLYKLLIDKYASNKVPNASIKYKLGKIYFDQNNLKEAEKVWGELMGSTKENLWAKMAEENLNQLKWSDKFKRYVGRKPASQGGEEKK